MGYGTISGWPKSIPISNDFFGDNLAMDGDSGDITTTKTTSASLSLPVKAYLPGPK